VIAGAALLQRRRDLDVETAGTLSVDGMPISWRTRAALDDVGIPWPRHASRQAERADLHGADLIIGLAPEHVEWIRREHADLADRTATLIRLTKQLAGPGQSLGDRVRALDLAHVELESWEEVIDPGGGDVDVFVSCAREIVVLVDRLAELL
jgi:protein-tyrosine-phosphatase